MAVVVVVQGVMLLRFFFEVAIVRHMTVYTLYTVYSEYRYSIFPGCSIEC